MEKTIKTSKTDRAIRRKVIESEYVESNDIGILWILELECGHMLDYTRHYQFKAPKTIRCYDCETGKNRGDKNGL